MAHAQNPWTPQRFGDKFLRQSWGWTEYVTFFWLVGSEVTGWCYRNLVLSLKLSSFTWVRALVSAEELKTIAMYICWGGSKTLLYLWSICSSLFPYSFPSLIRGYLNLPFGNQGRLKRLKEDYLLVLETGDMEKIYSREDPTVSCSTSVS